MNICVHEYLFFRASIKEWPKPGGFGLNMAVHFLKI